ncbi:MAG TPA: MAPEG family protein [Gammaproteobacteria bacterium]|nr:MAPEG family protein [Gammaproteobacteria bacterium]
MTIAYGCVLLMIIFPYLFTILAKTGPLFNNHTPREYLEHTTGWRKRAHWVQLNSFEITPAFAAGVIIAHQLHAIQSSIDTLATAFVITRCLYAACYLSDKAIFRSIVWSIGFGCIIGLFFIR